MVGLRGHIPEQQRRAPIHAYQDIQRAIIIVIPHGQAARIILPSKCFTGIGAYVAKLAARLLMK